RKMLKPPKNIEEFLKIQNWDYWPREVYLVDDSKWVYDLKKIKEDSSFTSIYTHLWKNVPRMYDTVGSMESRLEECSVLLQNHATKIFEWDSIISKTGSQRKLESYKAFIRKYHKKKKIMEKIFKIWKTHFLSEASIALLHDAFWWWFLYKFKPDKQNQDSLFDRISESYVTLFMSIPLSRKDAFFQMYPDCLAQAIYATFQEAFPESSNLFNDEFKEDLGNNIFLWLSGLRPQKGFWTHWKLKELSTTTIHGTKKAPLKSIQSRIARSQERITNKVITDLTFFFPSQSHYCSPGPEFYRVLLNIGSQSPLILHYLKMHELAGISKAPRKSKMKFTAILREPYPFLSFAIMRCF
ncbi:hypothetical protein PAL_GLEAN10023488, partial [Pteropus alecto]